MQTAQTQQTKHPAATMHRAQTVELDSNVPENRLPAISIVVPSFNQGQFIERCLQSILEQGYPKLEVHVVDGGSTDETVDVLHSFDGERQIKWTSKPDKGVVDAVNQGFQRCTGDVVGIQSSDDLYLTGVFDQVANHFAEHQQCDLLYGDCIKVDADGNELLRQPTSDYSLENLLTFRTWIPQPSAFFRRAMLSRCGAWDESVPYAADTDLWYRIALCGTVQKLPEFLSQRRMHDQQRDLCGEKIIRDYGKTIRRLVQRDDVTSQIKRCAIAGDHLLKIRYRPDHSFHNAWHTFCAGWADRELRDWNKVFWHLALPIRKALSPIKSTLLGRK